MKFLNLNSRHNFWNSKNLDRNKANSVNSAKYKTQTITSLGANVWKNLTNDNKRATNPINIKIQNEKLRERWLPLQIMQSIYPMCYYIWLGIENNNSKIA